MVSWLVLNEDPVEATPVLLASWLSRRLRAALLPAEGEAEPADAPDTEAAADPDELPAPETMPAPEVLPAPEPLPPAWKAPSAAAVDSVPLSAPPEVLT